MIALPRWVRPQLTQLVDTAPEGDQWLHEIKYDGYRMMARLDRGAARLLTRTGLDWTHKYPAIATAASSIGARQAYLDGELCGVGPDGITSFSMIQLASDSGNAAALVFFVFDLLHLDGEDLCPQPLIERKTRLAELLPDASSPLQYCGHQIGHGRRFTRRPARRRSRALSRNAPIPPTPPATAACGSRSNACTARNLSSSSGPIPKALGRISARCCWATTIRAGASSMPAEPAPASSGPNWSACGAACSRWRHPRCRSIPRRRATAGSDRRWS